MLKILIATVSYCVAFSIHAQVFKCKDNTGKIVYSDTVCSSTQTGNQLFRERTFEEKLAEREQAYAAQMAKEERRAREEARERAEAERRAMIAAMQPPSPRPKGYAETLAERNASVQSVFAPPKTRAQRGLPPERNGGGPMAGPSHSPPAPSVITHCAGGFCHDNTGGVYHQHGNGVTMTGPNGNTCVQSGSMVNC